MTSTNLSRKQLNFAQISIVCVDILKQCLIDILHIHINPTDLGKEIRLSPSLTAGKDKLSSEQKDLCCPSSPSVPDYSKFDVTLLYKLIRNLCPKLKPSKEWGKEPDAADQKIGDDIERIRLFRNKHYAHPNSAEITESDFTDLWNKGKSLIHRIQIFTTAKGCKTDYGLKLTDISGRMIKYEEYTSYVNLFRAIYIESNVEVTCGDTAHFKADIRLEESAFLSVSWERVDGSARKHIDVSCEKYKGSTSRQLNIHSVCKEDEGGYQAVISRNLDHKIFSNIGFLQTQGELPRLDNLKVSTDKGEICIHYSHTVLENSPRVNDIEWTKNKTPLDLTNHKYCGGGLENSCLTISFPTKEDGGEYSCTVSNAVGSVSRVVILEEPSAKISTNTPVVHGSETRFSCLISSCPSPEQIEWQKSCDGNTFHRIDIKELKYHGSIENPSSPVLCLPKTTFDDQQFYRIAVRNKIGECMSNTHFLEVTGSRPNITNATCTTKDRSVRLNCDVFLYDKSPALLDVYWTKTEQRLDIQGSGGKYSGVSTDDPSLTINNVNEHDAGEYQLTAINSVGPTKSDVIVLGVPDIVLKRINRNEDGSQCFTMTISSLPAPFFVQWSMKDKKSGTLQQINVNADEYKGTSNSFPRPVLVVKHNESLENYSFRIQVENVIGSTEKIIPDETNPIFLKSDENTVNVENLNRIYERRGRNIRFGKVFDELAEKFPEAKISRLKDLIQNSCEFEDVKSLERAKSARDCFRILRCENIFTPEDVMFLQHLLKTTECEELETKCIEYAKMHDAMYYYEKPPDNGYKNVHFHVVANIRCYGTENITKVRETVAAIVGCTIEEVLVNGYLHSASFILVLSIKNDFLNKLLALKRKDKDKLSKLSIDYFRIGSTTIRLEFSRDIDEHTTVYPYVQSSGELSEKPSFSDYDLMESVYEKDTRTDKGSPEKKEKVKPKSKLKEKEEEMKRIFNDTMEDFKKLTLPDVNSWKLSREKDTRTDKGSSEKKSSEKKEKVKPKSRGNLKEDTVVDDSQSERGGRRQGGRGKRRGKGTKSEEALPGGDGEEDKSGNDSDTNHVSQSSRGRGANRRGRGRGRGGLQPSGSIHDLNVRDDSDNESVCCQTSQSGRGSGGRNQRGGRGRGRGGRGNQRGGRGRGRGGRGANSQRHYSGGQEGDEDEAEIKPQQATLDLGDEFDENFSEAKVFRYLVKTLGGCASIQKFKEEFSPLPADYDDWIKTPKNRLSVYKRNGRPVVIGPYLKGATVCVDNMGFAGNKKCNRKECNHFHVCKFFLNGWCKRGFKCRRGHTFTKGQNRELKAKLGLNPFKDAEIKTIILCRYPQICPNGRCNKEDCPYLHICFNFVRDKCEDSDCSRGHDLGTPHNLWVLSVYRMEKWPVEKMALLKFLINKPKKPRTKKIPGDTTESTIDPPESVGSVEDEDFEENEDDDYIDDDDDDDDDYDYDDDEDDAEGDEEVVGEVYHYPEFVVNPEPKAETLPKKSLDRKNRWNTNEEESVPIEIAEKASTNTSVQERDADKKDICPSLIPGSCREKKCDRHHTPLPYLWQIRILGTWVSFNDEENEKLERGYCNLEEIGDAEVEHEERKYKIRIKFNENIGMVYEIMHGEESLNTNDLLNSRRLSTASFGKEKKPLTMGSFHTQWRWYFRNDVGQWVPFDKDRFQYTLEKKYVMGQKNYLFTRENYNFKYRIEFADWTQANLDTGKERKILRRPVLVSITDVAARIYPPLIAVSAPGPVPLGWAPWDLAHPFELVELDESCKEYKEVKGTMFDTLKEDYFTISYIYRIQSLGLWKEYRMRKTNMKMDHEMRGENVNEKSLFHGTDSIDTCYGICTNNFDFRLSGKNATMYGKGSYFSTTAKYSNCYTRGPLRLMFRARVLIGRYTKGEKDIACPPNIPGEGHKRFDSCVDNETNPSVFVVFDRNQSYPEHLIAYRGKDDELSSALNNPVPVSNPMSRPSSLSSLQSTASGVAQASSSSLGNISQSAQSSPSQLYSWTSSGIGTPQPASSPGVMYNIPYLSSPSSTTILLGTSRSPSESQSLSYRTASGRKQKMSYPESKKKDETCSIQ